MNQSLMDGDIMLGDLLVIGTPPAKLWKALAVIADGCIRASRPICASNRNQQNSSCSPR